PSTIYIGASCGAYKSVNGGSTWTYAGGGLPFTFGPRVTRLAISRSNPATLYALIENITIYKSTSSGGNWFPLNAPLVGIPVTSQLPLPLVVAPDNPDSVYVGSRASGIFKSRDGGATWNTINTGLSARDIRAISVGPNSPEKI